MLAGSPRDDEVVEISSDEEGEVEDGQPQSSSMTLPWSHGKRPVVALADINDYLQGDFQSAIDFDESTPLKRQKIENEQSADTPQASLGFATVILAAHPEQMQFEAVDARPLNECMGALKDPDQCKGKSVETGAWAGTASHVSEDLTGISEAEVEESPEVAPYYYDDKLETRMYRGPGYEKFPIVLGTIPGHKAFCERWDRRQTRRLKLQQPLRTSFSEINPYVSDDDDEITMVDFGEDEVEENVRPEEATRTELDCLERILEVLPDVKRDFALGKIRGYAQSFTFDPDEEIQVQPSPAEIVSGILELPDYPREEHLDEVAAADLKDTGVTIEWQRSDPENKSYQKDAVCLLAGQFDYVPTHFIHKTVQEKLTICESYRHIHKLEADHQNMNPRDRPYRRNHEPRIAVEKKYALRDGDTRNQDEWNNLVNEMQATRQQLQRERLRRVRKKDREAKEAANFEEHKARGDLVECRCCFDDGVPSNRTVPCEGVEVHWFCFSCVQQLAENQIGLMRHEMSCMDGSGCKAPLSPAGIEQAVPAKVCEKLAAYKQQSEIMEACIDGLEQCAFCDFKAICDPIEEDPTFRCQNPECRRVSCRQCHEADHLPRSCEEAKKDKGLSARHRVEEARSEAMIRTCPQCKVKIVKESGCNKMRCSQCGGVMCYVCKKDISHQRDSSYDHFNKKDSGCKLYDRDFSRHDREADEAEKEAIKQARAENADLDEKQLQVKTGMKKVDKVKRAKPPDARPFRMRQVYGDPINIPALAPEPIAGFLNGRVRPWAYYEALAPQMERPRPETLFDQTWQDHLQLGTVGATTGNGGAGLTMSPAAALPQRPLGVGTDYVGGALLRPDLERHFQAAAGNYNGLWTQPAQVPVWPFQAIDDQGTNPVGDWRGHRNNHNMYHPMGPVGGQAVGHGLGQQANMAVPGAVAPPRNGRVYDGVAHSNAPPTRPATGAAWF